MDEDADREGARGSSGPKKPPGSAALGGSPPDSLRLDHRIVASLIEEGSRVLDLGCGGGELLEHLIKKKRVEGFGVEINEEEIYRCVERGLSVSHEDIDSGLKDYPDLFFDYVIFNQTMQQVHMPRRAIEGALRIGKRLIIGFPNFCQFLARLQIGFSGHVPITHSLPYTWYETPNLHFLSIRDFHLFCRREGLRVLSAFYLAKKRPIRLLPNLFAYNAILLVERA